LQASFTNVIKCGHVIVPKKVNADSLRVLGLDPSGGRSPWGFSLIRRRGDGLWKVEVIEELESLKAIKAVDEIISSWRSVYVIALDAPIGWPQESPLRCVDRVAILLGARILPPAWKGMRGLSEEGLKVYLKYCEAGRAVIETHPYSASQTLGLNVKALRSLLGRHAADALIAAIVGAEWAEGLSITLCQGDGALTLPLVRAKVENEEVIIFKRFKWSPKA
jgi:predicted nuclease with RNAse H fold